MQAWSPYLREDTILLEKVQQTTTKRIKVLDDMNYYDNYDNLGDWMCSQ